MFGKDERKRPRRERKRRAGEKKGENGHRRE
jgi:hypothetical protein